jgi:hypothetical protein
MKIIFYAGSNIAAFDHCAPEFMHVSSRKIFLIVRTQIKYWLLKIENQRNTCLFILYNKYFNKKLTLSIIIKW